MKKIEAASAYDKNVLEVIALLIEKDEDHLQAVEDNLHRVDMEELTPKFVRDNFLIEHGVRPTTYPYILVIDPDNENEQLSFTYITMDMFKVD